MASRCHYITPEYYDMIINNLNYNIVENSVFRNEQIILSTCRDAKLTINRDTLLVSMINTNKIKYDIEEDMITTDLGQIVNNTKSKRETGVKLRTSGGEIYAMFDHIKTFYTLIKQENKKITIPSKLALISQDYLEALFFNFDEISNMKTNLVNNQDLLVIKAILNQKLIMSRHHVVYDHRTLNCHSSGRKELIATIPTIGKFSIDRLIAIYKYYKKNILKINQAYTCKKCNQHFIRPGWSYCPGCGTKK